MNIVFNFIQNSKFRFFIILNICYLSVFVFYFIKDIKYFSLDFFWIDFFENLMRYFVFVFSSMITLVSIRFHKTLFYLSPIIFLIILRYFIVLMFYVTVNYDIRNDGNTFILVTSVSPYRLFFVFVISFFIELFFLLSYKTRQKQALT